MTAPVTEEKKARLLNDFTEMMKGLYGDKLISLNIFGEEAHTEALTVGQTKFLAILDELGLNELKKYSSVQAKWAKKGIPAPLMLTPDDLKTSTDVFSIEFLEMKESYRLLHGKDLLAGLEIGLENLRRECEEQVKGKLLHLRQGYVGSCADKAALSMLIASSVLPFTDAMRNLLRLMGRPVPKRRHEVIAGFCSAAGLKEAPFNEALGLLKKGGRPGLDELDKLFDVYLKEVSALAEMVDKMTF